MMNMSLQDEDLLRKWLIALAGVFDPTIFQRVRDWIEKFQMRSSDNEPGNP
jgi:hypothetical protein